LNMASHWSTWWMNLKLTGNETIIECYEPLAAIKAAQT